jgi:hypothetical protein
MCRCERSFVRIPAGWDLLNGWEIACERLGGGDPRPSLPSALE